MTEDEIRDTYYQYGVPHVDERLIAAARNFLKVGSVELERRSLTPRNIAREALLVLAGALLAALMSTKIQDLREWISSALPWQKKVEKYLWNIRWASRTRHDPRPLCRGRGPP